MNIKHEPEQISQRETVKFWVDPPADAPYKYTWTIDEVVQSHQTNVLQWSTDDCKPGAHTIKVQAELDPRAGQVKVPKDAEQATDEITVTVRQQRVGVDDLYAIKDNIGHVISNAAQTIAAGIAGHAFRVAPAPGAPPFNVALQQTSILNDKLRDLGAFFAAIRDRTGAIQFKPYNDFIDRLLCKGNYRDYDACSGGAGNDPPTAAGFGEPTVLDRRLDLSTRPSIYGVDAYNLLRLATEAFLVFETGLVVRGTRNPGTGQFDPTSRLLDEAARLGEPVTLNDLSTRLASYLRAGAGTTPYLHRIVEALLGTGASAESPVLPYCEGILRNRLRCPSLLELIWSYWHEEGMLVQTLNAISLRFQNRRTAAKDPLAHLEIDPLRPLNNLLWGYVQDEQHRLTLPRRAYEYDHHYGLTIYGKAVPALQSADSRSKFLEGFHNLLYRTSVFYHEDADTTVNADAFPLLNALREVHLLLAEGAHNQFGDLPWTARVEMLIQQWLLSRPEMREFLRGRAMVPYQEAWMGQVDTMKRLQGWTDVTVTNFHELGVFGEQLLLSIRHHDWSVVNDQNEAKFWARDWRAEIQRYIHSYRAVTGVDLTAEPVDATPPWVHLGNRLAEEQRRKAGRP